MQDVTVFTVMFPGVSLGGISLSSHWSPPRLSYRGSPERALNNLRSTLPRDEELIGWAPAIAGREPVLARPGPPSTAVSSWNWRSKAFAAALDRDDPHLIQGGELTWPPMYGDARGSPGSPTRTLTGGYGTPQ